MNNYIILLLIAIGAAIFSLYSLQKKKNSLQEIEYTIKDDKTMELNSDYIITKIAWTKNEDNKLNYLLGVFEAANDPSFSDAIPIAMIKDQEVLDEINYIDVKITKYYKYLRYTPPISFLYQRNNDISPIKLYGKPASVINTNLQKDFQPTNLPLITIYTQNSTDPVSKEEKIDCEVSIVNEEKTVLKENATIRVRGKSTSAPPKKPYLIKFSKKQTILGFKGSYKKWTLLSNLFDISSIRNALAFKMSELMKFDFTPRCFSVDLILNGAYRGNYYLCDDVEIGPDRINIDEIKKKGYNRA